jgi:phage tail sheath protein FI
VPQQLTHPGVYIEEVPSGVRTIIGVATSITAFAGRTRRGTVDEAVQVSSYSQFIQLFGGLWDQSRLAFAVRDFYLNGGTQALIARVFVPPQGGDGCTRLSLGSGAAAFKLKAASPGSWGNGLRAVVDHKNLSNSPEAQFNLTITDTDGDRSERILAVTLYSDHPRRIDRVLQRESQLVRLDGQPLAPPAAGGTRVRPADGTMDKASEVEVDVKEATKSTVAQTAKLPAARAALRDAAAALAQAEQVKRDAEKAKADAVAEHAELQNRIPALEKAQNDAEATLAEVNKLDDADPTKKGKLARAQASADETKKQTEAAKTDLVAAEKRVTDADQPITDATNAISDRTADRDAAQKNLDDAEQAVADAKVAAQQERDKVANAFGPDQGDDGAVPNAKDFWDVAQPLLAKSDLFNLLCIPPYEPNAADIQPSLYDDAASFCLQRRAMLLVDPPSGWRDASAAKAGFLAEPDEVGARAVGRSAALIFPRLRQPNPLLGGAMEEFAPSGAVAGVFARTDARRGVWKAPAGLEASLVGVPELSVNLDDEGNGLLNPLGINCLRSFPVTGRVVWGSRTLAGADQLASEWKYIPIRRLALYIEESLYRGTQWVVFEPNDEPLWAQIRLNVGAFMRDLFRQGAFAGAKPADAYLVRCDKDTTTQSDRDRGIVNIVVGFAPLKPAEFVIIRLQQLAGQIET